MSDNENYDPNFYDVEVPPNFYDLDLEDQINVVSQKLGELNHVNPKNQKLLDEIFDYKEFFYGLKIYQVFLLLRELIPTFEDFIQEIQRNMYEKRFNNFEWGATTDYIDIGDIKNLLGLDDGLVEILYTAEVEDDQTKSVFLFSKKKERIELSIQEIKELIRLILESRIKGAISE